MGCGDSMLSSVDPDTFSADTLPQLTTRQREHLQATWPIIGRNAVEIGVIALKLLIATEPTAKRVLGEYVEIKTRGDQTKHKSVLEDHSSSIMEVLREVVVGVDDIPALQSRLIIVGQFHKKIQGFQPKYFLYMEIPFCRTILKVLGKQATEDTVPAYRWVVLFAASVLMEGLRSESKLFKD